MTKLVNPWLACDLLSWGRLILPHWRELRARHTGVLLVVTAAAALNTLLGVIQHGLLMLPGIASRRVRGPLFIIGHWRSGTTVLHHLLSLDPQFTYPNNYVCFAPHHFLLTEWLLRDGFNWLAPFRRPMDALPLVRKTRRKMSSLYWDSVPRHPMRTSPFRGTDCGWRIGWLANRPTTGKLTPLAKEDGLVCSRLTVRQPRRVVLKSPAHTLRVQTLLSMYPNAQFVCLTRSAEDTVASTIAMWKSMCAAYALGSTTETRWEEAAVEDFLAFQHALCGVRESLGPNQYLEIALEQLLKDPVATMRHLYTIVSAGGVQPDVSHCDSVSSGDQNSCAAKPWTIRIGAATIRVADSSELNAILARTPVAEGADRGGN